MQPDVPPLLLQRNLHALLQEAHELVRKRVAELRVRDDGEAVEEARGAHALRAVDDLRREDEVARPDLLAQGADCREGDDEPDAERLERGDVGARRDRGGRDGVADAVSGDEGDMCSSCTLGDGDGRARFAPGLQR